jgi:hypothetical protein
MVWLAAAAAACQRHLGTFLYAAVQGVLLHCTQMVMLVCMTDHSLLPEIKCLSVGHSRWLEAVRRPCAALFHAGRKGDWQFSGLAGVKHFAAANASLLLIGRALCMFQGRTSLSELIAHVG